MLFLMLIVALAVLVATWMALPWITAAHNEKVESDLNRGVAPAAKDSPSKATAVEQAQQIEFVEAHRGYKEMVGTEHYRALNPRCRQLIDDYVALMDRPADAAADNASVRTRAAGIQRSFDAECLETAAAAPATAPPTGRTTAPAGPPPSGETPACAQKREEADHFRGVVDLTLSEAPPTPGSIDEDKRERRESLEKNKARLAALEADIASSCR